MSANVPHNKKSTLGVDCAILEIMNAQRQLKYLEFVCRMEEQKQKEEKRYLLKLLGALQGPARFRRIGHGATMGPERTSGSNEVEVSRSSTDTRGWLLPRPVSHISPPYKARGVLHGLSPHLDLIHHDGILIRYSPT